MIKAGAKVEGAEQLITAMKGTHQEILKACKKGIDRTAFAIESDAKRKITADRHIITGRLRASIHAELKEGESFDYSDDNGNTYNGSLREKVDKMEAVAGTNVHYAPYIEFGTRTISADSFLGWAALKNGKLLVDRIMQELNKIKT
jgi:hypothetical protein